MHFFPSAEEKEGWRLIITKLWSPLNETATQDSPNSFKFWSPIYHIYMGRGLALNAWLELFVWNAAYFSFEGYWQENIHLQQSR